MTHVFSYRVLVLMMEVFTVESSAPKLTAAGFRISYSSLWYFRPSSGDITDGFCWPNPLFGRNFFMRERWPFDRVWGDFPLTTWHFWNESYSKPTESGYLTARLRWPYPDMRLLLSCPSYQHSIYTATSIHTLTETWAHLYLITPSWSVKQSYYESVCSTSIAFINICDICIVFSKCIRND